MTKRTTTRTLRNKSKIATTNATHLSRDVDAGIAINRHVTVVICYRNLKIQLIATDELHSVSHNSTAPQRRRRRHLLNFNYRENMLPGACCCTQRTMRGRVDAHTGEAELPSAILAVRGDVARLSCSVTYLPQFASHVRKVSVSAKRHWALCGNGAKIGRLMPSQHPS